MTASGRHATLTLRGLLVLLGALVVLLPGELAVPGQKEKSRQRTPRQVHTQSVKRPPKKAEPARSPATAKRPARKNPAKAKQAVKPPPPQHPAGATSREAKPVTPPDRKPGVVSLPAQAPPDPGKAVIIPDEVVGQTQAGRPVYAGARGGHYYVNDGGSKVFVKGFEGMKLVGRTQEGKAIFETRAGTKYYYTDEGRRVTLPAGK